MRRIALCLLTIGITAALAGCSKKPTDAVNAPAPVQITSLVPSSSYIIIHWAESPDLNFASYEVHELPDSATTPSVSTQLKVIADRSTTQYRVESLQPLTRHFYAVRTVVKSGAGANSQARGQTTLSNECPPPTAIDTLSVTDYTRTSGVIRWTASCDVNFSRYALYLSQDPNFVPSPENRIGNVLYCTDTSYVAGDLQENTQYYYRVVVVNTCEKTSMSSAGRFHTREGGDPVPPEPPPLYPVNRSDITGTTIRINWKVSGDSDWESYEVFSARQDGFGPSPANLVYRTRVLTDTTFTLTGLRPATTYYFLVLAKDVAGNTSRVPANTGVLTSPPLDPLYRFGGFGTPPGNFITPQGAALDKNARVLIANTGNNRVDVFAAPLATQPDTSYVMRIPNVGDNSFTLNSPIALALNDSGQVYISEQGRQRVVRTSPTGAFEFAFGGPGSALDKFSSIAGLTVDADQNVWVVDNGRNRIVKFSATGTYLAQYSQAFSGFLSQPTGIWYDAFTNRILVVDSGNQRVAHFSVAGVGLQGDLGIFGVTGADSGVFNQPTSVTTDAEGTVYVSDTGNERIQVYVGGAVRPQGIFRTTISPAQFEDFNFNMMRLSHPKSAVAIPGRLLVVDTGASRCVVASVTLSSFQSGNQAPRGRRASLRMASRSLRR